MPSKKQYDLVTNDDYDTRIPLHTEEAFNHGIAFQAKYIGTLDVPKPQSKLEIVAAMRRIRYEFKSKGVKKKKVTIEISVDGVRVLLRKKKKKKQWLDEASMVLMQHPVYRIFYVSHDSQDLKIFSYIARDSTNVFKCSVFKSNKKSQAMRVVRTVGQAFDVCHKLSINSNEEDKPSEKDSTLDRKKKENFSDGMSISDTVRGAESNSTLDVNSGPTSSPNPSRPLRLDLITVPPHNTQRKSPLGGVGETYSSPMSETLESGGVETPRASIPSAGTPLGAHHELQLLREQLEQQTQQTQAAVAQVHLLRDQLAAETAARLEAQTRIHQLLVQNKELLDHISALVQLLQEQERLQQGNQTTVTAVPQHIMMGDVGGSLYPLPPELGGGGPSGGAYLPAPLSNSYYNILTAGAPLVHHPPPSPDYLQRLRAYYAYVQQQQLRPNSASFPGTPILPHRSPPLPSEQPPARPAGADDAFIRPLGDDESKSRGQDVAGSLEPEFRNLRLQDSRPTFIQRSTSEKVPNRSELMSQVNRAAWARHTTK